MEQIEKNRTLLPLCCFSVIAAFALCSLSGFLNKGILPFLGMFLVFWLAAFVGLLLLYVLFLLAVSLTIDTKTPQTRWQPFYHRMVIWVEGLLCAFGGVRVHVRGLENVPEGRFLLVGNHRSNYDPIIASWVLRRRRLAFVSKPQNMRLPIVGPFLHKACYLGIDREDDRAALRTILAAAKNLKEDLASYGIYPEGRRNTGAELLPFRNGAFKIAQKAKAPVVVAVTRGSEHIHKNFPWRRTDVYLDFRAVLDAETVSAMNTSEIGEEVKKWITTSADC